MKPITSTPLLLLAAGILAGTGTSSHAQDLGQISPELVEKYASLLAQMSDHQRPAKRSRHPEKQVGLSLSSLQTSSLDTGTGLGVTTRGLTTLEEWRSKFPLKNQAQ